MRPKETGDFDLSRERDRARFVGEEARAVISAAGDGASFLMGREVTAFRLRVAESPAVKGRHGRWLSRAT
jgi:hypothetical protein